MMRLFVAAMLSASLWRGFAIDSSDDNRPSRLMRKQGIDTPAVQLTSDGDVQHGSSHQESEKNVPWQRGGGGRAKHIKSRAVAAAKRPAAKSLKKRVLQSLKRKIHKKSQKQDACTEVPVNFELLNDEADCSLAYRTGHNEKPSGKRPGHIKCNTALELAVKNLRTCEEMVSLHNEQAKAEDRISPWKKDRMVHEDHAGDVKLWDALPEGCTIKNGKAYFKNGDGKGIDAWYGHDEKPTMANYFGAGTAGYLPICLRPRYMMGMVDANNEPQCGCGYEFVKDPFHCTNFLACGTHAYKMGYTALEVNDENAKDHKAPGHGCYFKCDATTKVQNGCTPGDYKPVCKIKQTFLR